jgi:hypothetical protein
MARTNAVMEKAVVGAGMDCVMTWTAIGGTRTVTCDSAKIPEETKKAIYVHGMNAKVGDAAALKDATVDEKMDAMEKVVSALYAGTWRGEREASDSDLIAAILSMTADDKKDAMRETLKKASSAEKSLLRVHPPVKKILDKMAADAVKKSGIDPAAILAKFIHS